MYDFEEFEEFYGETGEYEQMIDDLKHMLMRKVKREIQDEMERLKAENAKLQEVKEKWDDLVGDYKEKEYKMKYTLEEERRKIARMRLADLFDACGMNVILYKPTKHLVYGPKCDKCDADRYIHFTSPSGKEMKEYCECRKSIKIYAEKPYKLIRFYRDARKNLSVTAIYEDNSNESYDDFRPCSVKCEKVYAGESFDTIYAEYESAVFFEDEAKCKEYCDYINAINKVPEDVLEIARITACCD